MQSVGYWQAWDLWLHGVKLDNYVMWALPLVWWSRIGKLLQYVGGTVVVLDLIGPERMVQISHKLKRIPRALLRWTNRQARNDPVGYFIIMCTSGLLFSLIPIGIAVGFTAKRCGLWDQRCQLSSVTSAVEAFLRLPALHADFAVFMIVGLFEAMLILSTIWIVPFLLAKVFAVGRRANLARWIAFALLTVGFHFDLLGG